MAVSCIILLISILLFLNVRIHTVTRHDDNLATKNEVRKQLHFIGDELKHHQLGSRMQQLFPEGYMFTYALYGLTWSQLATVHDSNYENALSEARYAYEQMNTLEARSNFDANLSLPYGMFYRGWKNYLLANLLAAQTIKDSTEWITFEIECNAISAFMNQQKNPYPESYRKSSWPADAFVTMASLKLHDQMTQPLYNNCIRNWLNQVRSVLDTSSDMLPHAIDGLSGVMQEGSRGSSMSLMLHFLAELDPEFATQQFLLYQKKFASSICGLAMVREFKQGNQREGDIDSGPVIFGMGPSATLVAAGTYIQYGESELADQLVSSASTFGCSYTTSFNQIYLLGQLPIADAFIAWSRVQHENQEIVRLKGRNKFAPSSLLKFHSISGMILLLLVFILYKLKITSRK